MASANTPRPGELQGPFQGHLSRQIFLAMSDYNQLYKLRVITLLQDLKVLGVDIRDTDSLAQNPKSYEDIGEIGKRLTAFAKQIRKP